MTDHPPRRAVTLSASGGQTQHLVPAALALVAVPANLRDIHREQVERLAARAPADRRVERDAVRLALAGILDARATP
jgi:hypothetical protein